MSQHVRDLMSTDVVFLESASNVFDAARTMRDRNIGGVLVRKDGKLTGIVTDRDLVLRCLAEERDPKTATLEQICSSHVTGLEADATVDEAVKLMTSQAVRRLPVLQDQKVVGIVSLGDLAQDRQPDSALGQISEAPPTSA